MSTAEAIGLVGGLASIAALLIVIRYAFQYRRAKYLVYEVSKPVPLAMAASPEDTYKLSVTFQREGEPEERLESVFVRFLRFANVGREPVRRADIAPANPLRVEVQRVRTLDIGLVATSRPVNAVAVSNQSVSESTSSANVSFDFLDSQDGAVIRVLTVGGTGTLRLCGDIIGMPHGIKDVDEVRSRGWLNRLGCALGTLLVLSSFVLSFVAFYWVTGAWTNVWLLFLPFVSLIIPAFIIVIVTEIWPARVPPFPPSLAFPGWLRPLQLRHIFGKSYALTDDELNIVGPEDVNDR